MGRSKHRSKKQALKSLSALQQEDAYEQEIQSTEAGRRSHELRAQAGRLQGHGDLLGAHELYAEAASLFPLEDLGAAAASAFYDLGESYKKVASRRSLEDLLESKRLLQQTLRSPSRQRVPIRMAASHDALAQTLRRLTDLQASPEQRHERLKEAIDHHDQACALAEGCDIVGLESAASYHLNRGNAYDELGDLGAALAAYRRARALADRTLRIANATVGSGFVTKPQLPQHIRVAMMSVLLRRGRKTDLDEALRLASEAIDGADPSFAATAHLLAARILAKNAAHRRTELSRHLEAIDPRDLGFEHWRAYIDILAETGDSQNAVAMARHAVVRALRERKGALADHVADRCAEKAQRFAVREAEIHVDEGRAIDAFLALENASGLRYFDTVKQFLWRPRSPVFRVLRRKKVVGDSLAVQMDDLAAWLALFRADRQGEMFERLVRELELASQVPGVTEEQTHGNEQLLAALRQARRHPSPRASLRAQAQEMLREGECLHRAMEAVDPSYRDDVRVLDDGCTKERLSLLLAENPGFVLLRLHLAKRLIAVATWVDADGLQGACTSLPVPDRIGDLLSLKERPSDEAPEVATILECLDLSEVLPSRAPRCHAVVLPSALAARIPWAAAGPRGATLLDRFDAISYLPVLTPLQGRQPPRPPRHGMTTLLPGDELSEPTKFHGPAFESRLEGETLLWDEQANLEAARRAAQQSDVIVFYTHGLHDAVEGGIQLAGRERLRYWELGTSWAGCERVELWACQTSVNEPTNVLTPPFVDEAFGTDIAFHRVGVRSTIGTLWSVPDAVTAYIVRWYRHELSYGCDAPTALARAQRRWRDELIPRVRQRLESGDITTLIEEIAAEFGSEPRDLESDLDLDLSDLNAKPLSEQNRELLDRLTHPKSWAGYRFVGVCERRPTEPWTEEDEHPLTADEQAQVERLLREAEREAASSTAGAPPPTTRAAVL